MTVDWRARVLQRPEYIPRLDLVVEGPNGELAAFCVCWIAPTGHGNSPVGQVEPLGVHPEYQKMGLGRAVLLEGVRRMQSHGATTMIVETDDFRDAAVGLYQAAEVGVRQKILVHRFDIGDRE